MQRSSTHRRVTRIRCPGPPRRCWASHLYILRRLIPRDCATTSGLSPNWTPRPCDELGSAHADRFRRRVIQIAGIIFSHARADSFQHRHVKTNVNILMAYLLRAGTAAFPRANRAAMPVRAPNRSTLTPARKRLSRSPSLRYQLRAKTPPRPVEPLRRSWLPFDSGQATRPGLRLTALLSTGRPPDSRTARRIYRSGQHGRCARSLSWCGWEC